jgi:RNA recognition motif-containing protein
MAKKLYVGNLPYSMTDEGLNELFSQAGTVVSATVIKDRFSGRPKGFGFVEMSSDEEAEKGIQMFNGKEIDGRAIVVNEARPMEESPRRRDFSGGGRRDSGRGRDRGSRY